MTPRYAYDEEERFFVDMGKLDEHGEGEELTTSEVVGILNAAASEQARQRAETEGGETYRMKADRNRGYASFYRQRAIDFRKRLETSEQARQRVAGCALGTVMTNSPNRGQITVTFQSDADLLAFLDGRAAIGSSETEVVRPKLSKAEYGEIAWLLDEMASVNTRDRSLMLHYHQMAMTVRQFAASMPNNETPKAPG